jgi:phosphate transport system substrate-binding protein
MESARPDLKEMAFMKKLLMGAALALAIAPLAAAQNVQIDGAGATFPYPIYSKWFSEYNKKNPTVQINYQSIGSGGGIRQLTNQTVFFGATDGPMTKEQLGLAPGSVLHFPTVLGGVVPIYNVKDNPDLKFSGETLAGIFMRKITKWNDAAIAKDNPGVTLPTGEITVVHRADGSGTTYIWCDFLGKVSPEYKAKVGVATAVSWPADTVGGKGNEGVAGMVQQTPNAIGYVELIYAIQNKLAYGAVKNMEGEFLKASLETVTAAGAATEGKMPPDFRVSITNAPGKGAYPISSFTWILLFESAKDKKKAQMMVDFMKWALADGQKFASELGYAPLPASVVKMETAALAKVQTK